MPELRSTILIPDISGYTEFMTTTELTHAAHALNYLIDAIVESVGDKFDVSEIEGDAVLLVKKGAPPSRKELVETCLSIFNAFHYRRKWLQQHTICPCGACQAIINLSLKFIAHYGPLVEHKIGRFVKQSGTDMIVAHRLLKNSIASSEYLLITEKLLQEATDSTMNDGEIRWVSASEVYSSIGKINFQFMSLIEARNEVPDPAPLENEYSSDDVALVGYDIAAPYMDVYAALTNIPERASWMKDLHGVEQEGSDVYIGSVHYCTFDEFKAVISPIRMTVSEEGIMYAERCEIQELGLNLIHEFAVRKRGEGQCNLTLRFINSGDVAISAELQESLVSRMARMGEQLKSHAETSINSVSTAR